jgi:hypothetical protein
VEQVGSATVYRGEVTLTVDGRSTIGWLGCHLDSSDAMRCGFLADDASWSLSVRAVRTVIAQSDGGGIDSYDGGYSAAGAPQEGLAGDGSAFARFEVSGRTVTVTWWLDPAAV